MSTLLTSSEPHLIHWFIDSVPSWCLKRYWKRNDRKGPYFGILTEKVLKYREKKGNIYREPLPFIKRL